MFLQCMRCKLCDQVETDQLKFLSIGRRNSPILVVDTQATWNVQFSTEQNGLLSMDFDEEHVNEQTFATFGSVWFTEHASSASHQLLTVFGSFDEIELTWAIRCATSKPPSSQMRHACGIYSRQLFMNRKIIVVTESGYQQLLDYLPLDGIDTVFTPEKLYKSPNYGAILTIKEPSDWNTADGMRYRTVFRKAKREVGLDKS